MLVLHSPSQTGERDSLRDEARDDALPKIMITDCHVHIAPVEMFNHTALELMKKKRGNWETIVEYCRSPKAFLAYMDRCGSRPGGADQLRCAEGDRVHDGSE